MATFLVAAGLSLAEKQELMHFLASWLRLRDRLLLVGDVLTIGKPAVFPVETDRPILFSALASARSAAATSG